MFSLIFFGFVAFILIVGFVITIRRKKSKRSLRSGDDSAFIDESSGMNDPARRSASAFNEVPPGSVKGGIAPAGSKRSQKDSGNGDETHD